MSTPAKPASTLSRTTMIGWGLGTLGPVMLVSSTNALLLRFMTDFVGLSAGLAAALIGLSKLYDAFADPTMGWLSDRTRSRWGRRRPYLLAGGALLALSMLALFWLPPLEGDTARTLYMGAVLIFYATAYTVFTIPYMAMPAEMSSSYHQRTELKKSGLVWNDATLDAWIKNPTALVPGAKMEFVGLSSKGKRDSLMAYLRDALK